MFIRNKSGPIMQSLGTPHFRMDFSGITLISQLSILKYVDWKDQKGRLLVDWRDLKPYWRGSNMLFITK